MEFLEKVAVTEVVRKLVKAVRSPAEIMHIIYPETYLELF